MSIFAIRDAPPPDIVPRKLLHKRNYLTVTCDIDLRFSETADVFQ